MDPSGLIVTAWDKKHCTAEEIDLLQQYTEDWIMGNSNQKDIAASKAEEIRAKYRTDGEYAVGDGNTGINGVQYSTNWYLGDNTVSNSQKQMLDFFAYTGTGLSSEVNVFGFSAEAGVKTYYDLGNFASDMPTQTMSFSGQISLGNTVQIGGSLSGTINSGTGEHLYNDCFAGIRVGNQWVGVETNPLNEDYIVTFSLGGYIFVGGEIGVNLNMSELRRRYFN